MPSLPETPATSRLFLLCCADLVLLLLSLSSPAAQAASLREHKLQGGESDPQRGDVRQPPNADMLKALEYIEGLRQRTGTDAQQRGPPPAGRADGEKPRATLRLDQDEGREDKSEELLRAVLSTLQQAEEAEGGAYPGGPRRQHAAAPHRKLPLMFEDEEEGEGEGGEEEGEEEEEEEDGAPDVGRHFKRTNENVEEKYTPQNLATLQSVFDELDKLTGAKAARKRQDEGADEEDEDAFDLRNAAYGGAGGDPALDWGSLQEEEEEDDNREADRGLDYVDDDEEEEEEEDGDSYPAKRSSDPDDVANLVDYYLLKVLEKTEEEEQKREIEEEEEEEEEERQRAERRAAQAEFGDGIFPQTIYEFIRISQKYQIPPEDLMDMLKTGEMTDQDQYRKGQKPARAQIRLPQISSKKTHTIPEAKFYSRRPPGGQKSAEELRTEEILNILGLGPAEDRAPVRKQKQYKSSPPSRLRAPPAPRSGDSAPTQRRPPGAPRDDYDAAMDEDELAAYLAAQMNPAYNNNNNNKASQKRHEAGQGTAGSFEQAIQDYFDQMDSDKSPDEKRQSEDGETSRATQMQGFENEAVMKLLSYLNPETEESDTDA